MNKRDYREGRVKVTETIKGAIVALIMSEKDIERKKKHPAHWYRSEIAEALNLTDRDNPSLRSYESVIQLIRKSLLSKKPVDSPWSIGSCENYNIPAEIVPILIMEQQTFVDDEEENAAFAQLARWTRDPVLPVLTIRKAQWFAILYPLVNALIENKYDYLDIGERQACLSMLVDQYSKRAQVADVMDNPTPNTSDLDEMYFLKEDLSLASIGEGFAKTFLPKRKGLGTQIRESIKESEITRSPVANNDKMNPSQKEGKK